MTVKSKDLIAIHFSVLLFGMAGIFGKLIDLHPVIIVLGRVFFASVFLLILLKAMKVSFRLSLKLDYFYMALLGFLLAIHWITFFQAIRVSTVAIGLLTFASFPVFTTILEPLFFREKLRINSIVLTLVTIVGIFFIIPDFSRKNPLIPGVLYGVISGFTFSILSVLNRKLVQRYSGFVIAFYQDFWAMFALMPFFFLWHPDVGIENLLYLALLGIVFTAIAHALFIVGLTTVKAQTASIIAGLEPVYGIVLALLLIGEMPPLHVIFGGLIILGAAFFASRSWGR